MRKMRHAYSEIFLRETHNYFIAARHFSGHLTGYILPNAREIASAVDPA
jgi:hypothetical protein